MGIFSVGLLFIILNYFFRVCFCVTDKECEKLFDSPSSKAYGNYCYFLDHKMRDFSWIQSENYCVGKKGHLVSIHTKEESDIVDEVATEGLFKYNTYHYEGVWIGLHSTILEGNWEWIDLTPVDFTNWRENEPSNLYFGDEDYAYISNIHISPFLTTTYEDLKWYDGSHELLSVFFMTALCKVEVNICFGIYSTENNVCNNRGKCLSDDVCSCEYQFTGLQCQNCAEKQYGPNCEITSCNGIWSNESNPNICNSRGLCLVYDQCTCDCHFGGDDCEKCEEGYYGEFCNITTCNGIWSNDTSMVGSICMGKGECSEYNKCSCDTNYAGDDCEIVLCEGIPSTLTDYVCNGHGDCIHDTANCFCDEHYFGFSCNITTCFGNYSNETIGDSKYSTGCNGKGWCHEHDRCVCTTGYFGYDCKGVSVCDGKKGYDPTVCEGHGDCILLIRDQYIPHPYEDQYQERYSFCDCYGGYYAVGNEHQECADYSDLVDGISQRDAAGLCNVKNGDLVRVYGDYCYYIPLEDARYYNWKESEDYCRGMTGGHLASIHSEEENEIIYQLGLEAREKGLDIDSEVSDLWIGLAESGSYEEGSWRWADDSKIDYLKWAEGQPDNFIPLEIDGDENGGKYDSGQDYTVMRLDNRFWYDVHSGFNDYGSDKIPVCKYKRRAIPAWALGLIIIGWFSILGFLLLTLSIFCVILCGLGICVFFGMMLIHIVFHGSKMVIVKKGETEKISLLVQEGEENDVEMVSNAVELEQVDVGEIQEGNEENVVEREDSTSYDELSD